MEKYSYLIHQNPGNLRVFDSQIAESHALTGMVESFTQYFPAHPEFLSLDIPESLTEAVCPVISFQIDRSTPSLDHTVDRLNRQG